MFDTPYDNPEVVSVYEDRYTHDTRVKTEVDFEVSEVERLIQQNNLKSWCDVACGTGHHLRNVLSPIQKHGIDKSMLMISQYNSSETNIDYTLEDFLHTDTSQQFDLVTNFWFGYSHQPNFDDVILFLNNMADITSNDGLLILSLHNQWNIFDRIPQKTKEPMGGTFSFDAMMWSYDEPGIPNSTYKCIVPHKDCIVDVFSKKFNNVIVESYPFNPHAGGKELLIAAEKKT